MCSIALQCAFVKHNPVGYLLPGLTVGILARSGGRLSAGNVSTFISIKLTNGQPKFGLAAPLRSTITPTAETMPSWRMHDVDCLLHAPAAGNDVFDHNEFLVGRNLKTAAQN